jgi:arylsulfatase A-like enzyme
MKQVLSLFLFAIAQCTSVFAEEPKTPNFVFFLVDDLGWGDLGCYGSTFHETPNLDRLAGEGMRFTNAYSACTVCSPSRAAILTGRYPGRLHLTDWIAGHRRSNPRLKIPEWNMRMDHELTTLPEALKEAGYRSQFTGKWHLMPIGQKDFASHYPESHGFDINVAGREWGQPKGPGKYFSPFGMPNLDDGEKGDFLTDRLTDEAVRFIEGNQDKPFLLYFSYYTVHGPIMAKPELVRKYADKAKTFENKRNEKVHPPYAGMIESLDESVGRVLDQLEKSGIAEQTVVIFTADNGGVSQQSSGGLRGAKALSYEGGTREPAIVKWPGKIAPGSVSDTPIIGTDFYPTMLSMAGQPSRPEAHLDGLDLTPVLTGKSRSLERDSLYWHYPHYHKTKPYGAIRQGDLKLIEFFETGVLELYDLKADPAEATNLAASQPEKAAQLHSALKAWRKSVNAQMPTPNPNYDANFSPKPRKPRKGPVSASTPLGVVSASSDQQGNHPANAVDGRKNTRWAADGEAVPQWWQVEFPEKRTLSGLTIHWKNSTWFDHRIEVSDDGKTWKAVAEKKGNRVKRLVDSHDLDTAGKFLRINVEALGSGWVSFTEVEIR